MMLIESAQQLVSVDGGVPYLVWLVTVSIAGAVVLVVEADHLRECLREVKRYTKLYHS